MHTGMQLKVDEQVNFNRNIDSYLNEVYSKYKTEIKESLEIFLDPSKDLNASEIEEEWFPSIDADIFLSHSHKDEPKAKEFAAWLYKEFGIRTFIDSCVWGNYLELQKKIDDVYCLTDHNRELYSYDKINNARSHVHTILSTSLAKMINRTECLLFFNTPNSIDPKEIKKDETFSPWIYSEIALSSMMRREEIDESRKEEIERVINSLCKNVNFSGKNLSSITESVTIKYSLDLDHLNEISMKTLSELKKIKDDTNIYTSDNDLDNLYALVQLGVK